MLELTVSGLLIAGLTGLTIIAYKHPQGYRRLYPYLTGVATAIFVLCGLWNLELAFSLHRWSRFIPYEKYEEARRTLYSQEVPYLWLLLAWAGFQLYVVLLKYLPKFIEDEKTDKVEAHASDL